jgi:hypothetical protein
LRRKPRPFGVCASHAHDATRADIRTPARSSRPPDRPSPPAGRSPTTPLCSGIRSFGAGLSPGHCRRARTRPVSCYALFEGWLLLSQPPGCLGARTSFATEPGFRDLSRRSGLLPSRRRSLAPAVSLAARARGIRGSVGVGTLAGPRPSGALPPRAPTSAAAPKGISGRTSYLRVRLAFHPYPQLIPRF